MMNLNLAVDEVKIINIRGRNYPLTIAGQGVPCLVVGNGLIVQRTLSAPFKEKFKVYATDLYWDKKYGLPEPKDVTFQQILEDIIAINQCLGLNKPIVLGFSAYGIVALELAKHDPDFARAIIMIGTPVNSNAQVAENNQGLFDLYADAHRKHVDSYRQALISHENLAHLSVHERFKRQYIFRDAPRYWHDPEFDCSALWEGIELDPVFEHFFASLIPFIDVQKNLEHIQIPIYLAAGISDFNCCPVYGWGSLKNVPPKFTMDIFHQSGHYPHYEEQALFDLRLIHWLTTCVSSD